MSPPPPTSTQTPDQANASPGAALPDPLTSSFVTPRGLPDVEALTAETFAALPKKKLSSLWTKADSRGGAALRARLAPLTNCASYLVCISSFGVAARRSFVVVDTELIPGDLEQAKAAVVDR